MKTILILLLVLIVLIFTAFIIYQVKVSGLRVGIIDIEKKLRIFKTFDSIKLDKLRLGFQTSSGGGGVELRHNSLTKTFILSAKSNSGGLPFALAEGQELVLEFPEERIVELEEILLRPKYLFSAEESLKVTFVFEDSYIVADKKSYYLSEEAKLETEKFLVDLASLNVELIPNYQLGDRGSFRLLVIGSMGGYETPCTMELSADGVIKTVNYNKKGCSYILGEERKILGADQVKQITDLLSKDKTMERNRYGNIVTNRGVYGLSKGVAKKVQGLLDGMFSEVK